jgi:hypothetical protein
MRIAFVLIIVTFIAGSVTAHADGDSTAFPLSNEQCAAVGDITLGANGRWTHCHVIKNGWFATIDDLDLYQSQYCLGNKTGGCKQRAQLLFANRAYTSKAKLLLQRVDSGSTSYDDPTTVNTENGIIMMLAKRLGSVTNSTYYYWQANHWLPIESQTWQRQLPQHLPKGIVMRTKPSLDIGTMSANAKLYRARDADCCPSGGVAEVNLILSQGRFAVKNVEILPNTK